MVELRESGCRSSGGIKVHTIDLAVEDGKSADWEGDKADLGKGQIVKTIHINQYASDS